MSSSPVHPRNTRLNRLRRLIFALLLCGAVAGTTSAQTPGVAVTGVVQDQTGAVLPATAKGAINEAFISGTQPGGLNR